MNSYYMLCHISIKPPSKTKEGFPKILINIIFSEVSVLFIKIQPLLLYYYQSQLIMGLNISKVSLLFIKIVCVCLCVCVCVSMHPRVCLCICMHMHVCVCMLSRSTRSMLSHISIKLPSKTKEGFPKIQINIKIEDMQLQYLLKLNHCFYINTSHN